MSIPATTVIQCRALEPGTLLTSLRLVKQNLQFLLRAFTEDSQIDIDTKIVRCYINIFENLLQMDDE